MVDASEVKIRQVLNLADFIRINKPSNFRSKKVHTVKMNPKHFKEMYGVLEAKDKNRFFFQQKKSGAVIALEVPEDTEPFWQSTEEMISIIYSDRELRNSFIGFLVYEFRKVKSD